MAVGGSMLEVSVSGRIFPVTADADASRDMGGYTAEQEANGDGSARKILTRKPWSLDGLSLEIDDDRGDQEFLQNIADSPDNVACVFTYVSGISYTGLGSPTGEIMASSQSASAPVSFKGPSKLVKQ